MGVNVGFPGEPGKVGVLGPAESRKGPGGNAGNPKVSFG